MKSLMRNLGHANRSGGKNKKEKVVACAENCTYWISTHPESKERAAKIIEHIHKSGFIKAEKMDSLRFAGLKERVGESL